jgi:hypothetical protein
VRLKDLESWLSAGEVSTRLGRSRQGVINLAEDGRVRAVRTHIGWLYDPESVEDFASKEAELKASKDGEE